MQLTLVFPSPNQHWDYIPGIIGRRSVAKFCLPSEKVLGFQLLSPETGRRRSLIHRKFRLRTITTLLNQLTNKQTDLTKAFVEIKRHNYET